MRSIGGGRRKRMHVHGGVSALVYSQYVASRAGSAALPNAGAADGEAAEKTDATDAETQGAWSTAAETEGLAHAGADAIAETQGNGDTTSEKGRDNVKAIELSDSLVTSLSCTFVVITWNACGMEEGAVNDMIDLLENRNWDAILLQEGPFTERSCRTVVQKGHILHLSPSPGGRRTAGILLHKRWEGYSGSFASISARLAYVDLNVNEARLRLISVHMFDQSFGDDEYEGLLFSLEEVVLSARRDQRSNIIGIDANATLGPGGVTDDPDIVGPHGHGQRNARGMLFAPWLHGVRLAALNSMERRNAQELWTHRLWSTNVLRQIDFILVDEVRRITATKVGTLDCLEGLSDHRPVLSELAILQPYTRTRRLNQPKAQIGWKPSLDEYGKPTLFHHCLDQGLPGCQGLDDVNAVVVLAAEAGAAERKRKKRQHTQEIVDLFAERRLRHMPREGNIYRRCCGESCASNSEDDNMKSWNF